MRRGVIGAVFVVGLLGASVVGIQLREGERAAERISLANVATGTIDEIVVSGVNPIKIVKGGERWLLESGVPADPGAVGRALESLKRVESNHLLASKPDPRALSSWGLGERQGTFVVFKARGNVVAAFGVGKVEGGRAPILFDGAVYAVKGVYPGLYSRSRSAWLKKSLFDFGSGDIAGIKVARAGEEPFRIVADNKGVTLERHPEASGVLEFDPELGEGFLRAVSGLRFKAYHEGEGVMKGGTEVVELTIQLKSGAGGAVHTLLIGGTRSAEGVLATWVEKKLTVRLAPRVAKSVRWRAGEFRSFRLMDFDPGKMVEFKLYSSTEYLYFSFEEGSWKVVDSFPELPEGFELDTALVSGRLGETANAKAIRVAPASDGRKVRLLKEKGPRLVAKSKAGEHYTLEFGARLSGAEVEGWYARGNQDNRVYIVPDALRRGMLKGADSFGKRHRRALNRRERGGDPAVKAGLPPQRREESSKRLQDPAQR